MSTNTPLVGIGGAPLRCTTLPEKASERKKYPIASGFMDYFGDAIAAIAHLSYVGNEQHNPGQPLHWDRSKSSDEADTAMRHFLQRGTIDIDGVRHTVKWVWRSLAFLQKELEAAKQGGGIVCEGQQETALDKAVRAIQEEKARQKEIDDRLLAQRDARQWRPIQAGEEIFKGDQYQSNTKEWKDFDASVGNTFQPRGIHRFVDATRTARPFPVCHPLDCP